MISIKFKSETLKIVAEYPAFASFWLSIYLLIGLLVRAVMLFTAPGDAQFTIGSVTSSIAIGAVNDLLMGWLLLIPATVFYLGWNDNKYRRAIGYTIIALLAVAFVYVTFFHTIFDEYGAKLNVIMSSLLGYKLISFSLRFGFPHIRHFWRKINLYLLWTLYVVLTLMIAVGEYFFWDEFAARYNFIAVDYLVYTNEVVGNIMQSYAIIPLVIACFITTLAITAMAYRRGILRLNRNQYSGVNYMASIALQITIPVLAYFGITQLHRNSTGNNYADQLRSNGAYCFCKAFSDSKLDYTQYYPMLPSEQCKQLYTKLNGAPPTNDSTTEFHPMNVVLITVESLSADFMARYGNTDGLTPNLDRLAQQGITLDSLYATGNRTVRGLEALSLCTPPVAGESIVKRPECNTHGRTIATTLQRAGYQVQYLYGGDAYFDNMRAYFGQNGYQVIDRTTFPSSAITFANIWGVADEILFDQALQQFDRNAQSGQPFFAQIMTTSNHRPFTYPEGRIQIQGNAKSRAGAVKYTDYAIGRFLSQATKHPWFRNTIFVVVADHCASSAGATSIPVDKYHIPCIIYAPNHVQPQAVTKRCSQIDVIPTILTLAGLPIAQHNTGQNILNPNYRSRIFMATYQDLGYWQGDTLTVLSPVRQVKQYLVRRQPDGSHTQSLITNSGTQAIRHATAYYQWANTQ